MQGRLSAVSPRTDNDKLISALGYIFTPIVPIIVFLTSFKQSRFNRIHAYQSLVFAGVTLVIHIVLFCVGYALVLSAGVLSVLFWLGTLLPLIPQLYLAYRVYAVEQVEFPYLTQATQAVVKNL